MALGQYSFGESYFGQGDAASTSTATFPGFKLSIAFGGATANAIQNGGGRPGFWRLVEVIRPYQRPPVIPAVVTAERLELKIQQRAATGIGSALARVGNRRRRRFRMEAKLGCVAAVGYRPFEITKIAYVSTQIDALNNPEEQEAAALALLLLCDDD
jgi:hypothetical protein